MELYHTETSLSVYMPISVGMAVIFNPVEQQGSDQSIAMYSNGTTHICCWLPRCSLKSPARYKGDCKVIVKTNFVNLEEMRQLSVHLSLNIKSK